MPQPIKITEQEFSEIRLLQGKFQEQILKMGTLHAEKIELDRAVTAFVEKEKKLKEEWLSLQKLEEGLLDKVIEKYGEGSLNMLNGTFTPVSAPTTTAPS